MRNALDLYYQAFKGTILSAFYRDAVEREIQTLGYDFSKEQIMDLVADKTEQLALMFFDEKREELLSKGISSLTVDNLLLPKLNSALEEFSRMGRFQTFDDVNYTLTTKVEQALLRDTSTLYQDEESHGSIHVHNSLKTLALLASWVPEKKLTEKHRKLRIELLYRAKHIAERISVIFQDEKKNSETLRREYLEFKWSCIDMIFSPPMVLKYP